MHSAKYHLNQSRFLLMLLKTFYAAPFLQLTVLILSKLSLLILLRRILALSRRFTITVWVLVIVLILYWAGAVFTPAFICFPISKLWIPNKEGVCRNEQLVNVISPLPWVVTDFAILIAPIPLVRKLQLPKRRRFALYAMFLFGGV